MILELLFGWLGFLIGPLGFFTLGVGFLTFLGLPVLSTITGVKRFANVHLWLGMWVVNRGLLVLSEHGDLLMKKMKYVDLGVERVTMAEDVKDFEDPAAALSHWMGFPFALGSERDGVLFDPRHAAIAARKQEYDKKDLGEVVATDSDYETWGVDSWLPGVFELPKQNELVDLSAIHDIVDGGERAEYPQRIEKLYKLSRDPFTSGKQALRLLIPVGAFIGVLVIMWQIAENSSAGSSGGTTLTTLLLLAGSTRAQLKTLAKLFVGLGVPMGVIAALVLFTNPIFALFAVLTFLLGLLFFPTIGFLAKITGFGGETLARQVFMKLGFVGYNRPTFEWTPRGYNLVEEDDLDVTQSVNWYSLLGSTVGFTYRPDESSFGHDVVDHHELEATMLTDGGDNRLPDGYKAAPDLLPSIYGGYVPENINRNSLYLNTGIALGRLRDAANGEKSLKRLLQSKERYGGGTFGVSDKLLLYGTLFAVIAASGLGTFLFFL